jgi:hypothetical protein
VKQPEFAPRRVVVALDASPGSLAALSVAAEIAARIHTELVGIFVEDINLIRLARLPAAGHVSLAFGSDEPLAPSEVEAHMTAWAAQARQALAAAARHSHVAASFRVARGPVVREVLAAAGEADLLILGWSSRPLIPHARPGRTARAAAGQALGSVLLLREGSRLGGPIVVVCDSSAGGLAALAAGARLAGGSTEELLVLATGESAEAAERSAAAAASWLREHERPGRCQPVAGAAKLSAALRAERPGILVSSAGSAAGEAPMLFEELGCTLLFVR